MTISHQNIQIGPWYWFAGGLLFTLFLIAFLRVISSDKLKVDIPFLVLSGSTFIHYLFMENVFIIDKTVTDLISGVSIFLIFSSLFWFVRYHTKAFIIESQNILSISQILIRSIPIQVLLLSVIAEALNIGFDDIPSRFVGLAIVIMLEFHTVRGALNLEIARVRKNLSKARELEKARGQFFHNVSHELRTPLNGIVGLIKLLQLGRYGDQLDDIMPYLEKISRLAVSLNHQVNTILDLAKSKKSELQPNLKKIDLLELLEEIEILAEGLAGSSGVATFTLKHPFMQKQEEFISDRQMLLTVVRNLLGNAFKFCDLHRENHVTLQLDFNEVGNLVVSVQDTGIGISKKWQSKVYGEFVQVEHKSSRSYEGSGLGLAMVKKITETLGGDMELSSNLGVGTEIVIIFPSLEPNEIVISDVSTGGRDASTIEFQSSEINLPTIVKKEIDPHNQKWLILIIDDNQINLEIIDGYLNQEGFRTLTASSGQDGLDKIREVSPDLVLLDLMMPFLSGEDVMLEIKKDAHLRDIPVIILTARASSQERLEGLTLGADDYLSKPVDFDELLLRVKNLLQRIELSKSLEALLHREKLAQLGEMMSDLSHELNNMNTTPELEQAKFNSEIMHLLSKFSFLDGALQSLENALFSSRVVTKIQNQRMRLLSDPPGVWREEIEDLKCILVELDLPEELLIRIWQSACSISSDQVLQFTAVLSLSQRLISKYQASSRAQKLLKSVLDISRSHRKEELCSLKEIILTCCDFLNLRFKRASVEVSVYVLDRHTVWGASSDFFQIFLNLFINAHHALVTTGSSDKRLAIESEYEAGCVNIKVTDNGGGVPAEILPQIFDRRFSTKGEEGSGLGLFVVKKLCTKNQGHINVESRDNRTIFTLDFPAAEAVSERIAT